MSAKIRSGASFVQSKQFIPFEVYKTSPRPLLAPSQGINYAVNRPEGSLDPRDPAK